MTKPMKAYPTTKEENEAIRIKEEQEERERIKALRNEAEKLRIMERSWNKGRTNGADTVEERVRIPRQLRGADREKYAELRKRMKSGEMIPREDFLFVKCADQHERASTRWSRNRANAVVSYGAKRIGGHFNP